MRLRRVVAAAAVMMAAGCASSGGDVSRDSVTESAPSKEATRTVDSTSVPDTPPTKTSAAPSPAASTRPPKPAAKVVVHVTDDPTYDAVPATPIPAIVDPLPDPEVVESFRIQGGAFALVLEGGAEADVHRTATGRQLSCEAFTQPKEEVVWHYVAGLDFDARGDRADGKLVPHLLAPPPDSLAVEVTYSEGPRTDSVLNVSLSLHPAEGIIWEGGGRNPSFYSTENVFIDLSPDRSHIEVTGQILFPSFVLSQIDPLVSLALSLTCAAAPTPRPYG